MKINGPKPPVLPRPGVPAVAVDIGAELAAVGACAARTGRTPAHTHATGLRGHQEGRSDPDYAGRAG